MASPAQVIGAVSLAALLGWALWEAAWKPALPPAPEPVSGSDAVTVAPTPPVTPLGDYLITLQRPLFFPGRRAPGEEPGDSPTATAGPAAISRGGSALPSLSAVIEEGGQRSALLTAPGQAVGTRLRPGEELGGWRLVSIADDSVTVESNGRREQIPLRRYGNAPPPAAARPASTLKPRFARQRAGTDPEQPPE